MTPPSTCVICDGPIGELEHALVAPFIAWRIWNRDPFCIDLVQCEACGFTFYNPRPDDDELAREYVGYRSDEYLQMRRSFEPWYTKKFNADLASPAHYHSRRAMLAPIFRQHVRGKTVRSVLDHGGDHGDLMLGLFGDAELFLYDISGATPAPGVTAVSDPASCRSDLIICSNVLEHVGFPRVLVSQILDAAPSGGLIFLETPCENALGWNRILRRIAQIPLMIAAKPRLTAHLLQQATLYMMHEHINYYAEQSLATLMNKCGGIVIASGFYSLTARAGSDGVVWVLGEKSA